MDGSLVWANQHHQSGTMMPSGAVHTIFASAVKQSILLSAHAAGWIASPSLSSGAHSHDPLARNDDALRGKNSQGNNAGNVSG